MSCYSSPTTSTSSSPSPAHKSPVLFNNNDNDCASSTSPRMTPLPPIELPLPTVPFSIVHLSQPPPPYAFHSLSPTTSPSLQPTPASSPPVISDRKNSRSQHNNNTGNGLYQKKRSTTTTTIGIDHTHSSSSSSSSTTGKTASERETHRRLSHSAIEKRRRERINDKIDQLKHLIPSCCPSPNTLPSASMHQPLHKLSVLQAAIDYIHQLHSQLIHHAPHLDAFLQHASSDVELGKILSHARRQHEQQTDHPPSVLHSP